MKNGVKEKYFDYVILGSSTGLTTLNSKLIDSTLNTTGLNISMDDSSLNSHYLMLQYFYALGKKTETLVLAITPWDVTNKAPKLNNNDYRFLSEIQQNVVFDYYSEIESADFPILQYSKFLPILGVSYYNNELFYPSFFTFVKPEKRNRFDDKGNYSYPNLGAPSKENEDAIHLDFQNPYFFKIVDFCKKKNIKLILYQSPLYKKNILTSGNYTIINHSNLIKDNTLFYDNLHVNKKGRVYCSEIFAKQFIQLKNVNLK
ncbi:hypothetical protein [Flavobacterium sp.]|uniref:hypothetical protein n=1 Tax=Flavobacterium sp. TaxID=239 RepID=UPI002A8362A3|nr:hypothetical protein [Flavobacterium sp.]